jgi:hypothetical protein
MHAVATYLRAIKYIGRELDRHTALAFSWVLIAGQRGDYSSVWETASRAERDQAGALLAYCPNS